MINKWLSKIFCKRKEKKISIFLLPSKRKLIKTIELLWQIIDNIDTAGDIAKSNDKVYREIVEKQQKKRWQCGITTDGYKLDLSEIKKGGKK